MGNITLSTAEKARQEALAGMRKLVDGQNAHNQGGEDEGAGGFHDEGTEGQGQDGQDGAGTGDDPDSLVNGDGQDGSGGHQDADDPTKNKGGEEGKGKDGSEARVAELEKQLATMTKSFKAIQSAITPTQQQNAALRRENEALKAKLGLVDAEGKPVDRLAKAREAAAKASEVVPEAGEALLALLDSLEHQGHVVEEARTAQSESISDAAMSVIYTAHPDADAVAASNSPFWKFVDSLQGASAFRAILAAPWKYEGGAQMVVGLMDDFKAQAGSAATGGAQPPVKRPTNVAAPVKGSPATPARQGAQRSWTPQELEAKTRNLNRMKPDKLAEARNELREQLYRLAPRRA